MQSINNQARGLLPRLVEGRRRIKMRLRRTSAVIGNCGSVTKGQVTNLAPRVLTDEMTIVITRDVYETIKTSVGQRRAETGAVLGGSRLRGIVTHVYVDQGAEVTGRSYAPDVEEINRLLSEEWKNVDFMGFVHSHPNGFPSYSDADHQYAAQILGAIPALDRIAIPVVQTVPDSGEFRCLGFVAFRSDQSFPAALGQQNQVTTRVVPARVVVVDANRMHKDVVQHPFRERVVDSYDPCVMTTTRIVAIGVGGSVGFLESMARCGVGEFVLIDPDVIEARNVGTQGVDPIDIGRPKVAALADKLARLNPHCHVWTVQGKETAIDDNGFHRLLREPLPSVSAAIPAMILLCAFTDSFPAQDRVQRVGLHFGVATLSAGIYSEGRGIEIGFSVPGITPACLRCAQSSRYAAYLERHYVDDVTSEATPFLATDRLNALKQVVTLSVLHGVSPTANPNHPATKRWKRTMSAIGDRNLALARLDPDSPLPSFVPLAQVTDGRCVIDETVWTRPTPDGPGTLRSTCPDCGGTGDLRDSIGAFVDTRRMPRVYGESRRERIPAPPQPHGLVEYQA